MRRFSAELTSLKEMINYVHEEAEKLGFDDTSTKKIELATEEAVVNIISHGYGGKSGPIDISLSTPAVSTPAVSNPPTSGIQIIIRDHGIPFNPLKSPPKLNIKAPLDERGVGGCGLLLITKFMDKVGYSREKDENVLTLVKFK